MGTSAPTWVDSGEPALEAVAQAEAGGTPFDSPSHRRRHARRWTASRWPTPLHERGTSAPVVMMLTTAGRRGARDERPRAAHRRLRDQADEEAATCWSAILRALGADRDGPTPARDAMPRSAGTPARGRPAAAAARRGQPRQPAADDAPAREGRARRHHRADRPRSAGSFGQTAVRHGADGRADAGDGRVRDHRGHPGAGSESAASTCRCSRSPRTPCAATGSAAWRPGSTGTSRNRSGSRICSMPSTSWRRPRRHGVNADRRQPSPAAGPGAANGPRAPPTAPAARRGQRQRERLAAFAEEAALESTGGDRGCSRS